MRWLDGTFYEVPDDGGEDGGTGEEGGDAEWQPSREEWDQMVGFRNETAPFIGELAQVLNQVGEDPNYGQQQVQQPQEPEFDPFDPESVQQYIQHNIQQGVEQALDPYSGVLGLVATREGEALAKKELETIRGEVGDFDQDAALLVASGLIDQGHDPSEALRVAAQYTRDYEARVQQSALEKYKQELQGLSDGTGEVPAGQGSGAEHQIPVPTGQDRYREAVENALARRRMTPTG